jgi:hypothetical protein
MPGGWLVTVPVPPAFCTVTVRVPVLGGVSVTVRVTEATAVRLAENLAVTLTW